MRIKGRKAAMPLSAVDVSLRRYSSNSRSFCSLF